MLDFIKGFSGQAWSAITLQVAILTASVYLIAQGEVNSFLVTSAVLVVSLFSLQVTSRRFLIFYPINQFYGIPTPRLDTAILKSFLIFAVFFLSMGAAKAELAALLSTEFYWGWFGTVEEYWGCAMIFLAPILLLVVPLFWAFCGQKLVRRCLVRDFQDNPRPMQQKCPHGDHERTVTLKVKSDNLCETVYECDTCKYRFSHQEPKVFGY
ncbi:MAG: hypothetical protein ACLFPU_07015 [Dehalococcoidia bacterium]